MSQLEAGLRRLRSAHPSVLEAMQRLYRANPDNRGDVDAIVAAAAQQAYEVHRAQTLARRCVLLRPAVAPFHAVRYVPDVLMDYLAAIGGFERITNATPEFRQHMKATADLAQHAPQIDGVDPAIDIVPGA